jgi:hypothetical protein
MKTFEHLSFVPPLKPSHHEVWETKASTVLLENKIVLAPQAKR